MLECIPTTDEIKNLLGDERYEVWEELLSLINRHYDMETIWNKQAKIWDYEYKYRRGGKTLCGLYLRKDCLGFMIIFGKAEREKFENSRTDFTENIRQIYDEATTYHDGKWMMIEPEASMWEDIIKLLQIKRRPNRK